MIQRLIDYLAGNGEYDEVRISGSGTIKLLSKSQLSDKVVDLPTLEAKIAVFERHSTLPARIRRALQAYETFCRNHQPELSQKINDLIVEFDEQTSPSDVE